MIVALAWSAALASLSILPSSAEATIAFRSDLDVRYRLSSKVSGPKPKTSREEIDIITTPTAQ